jgi:putative ABC transport system permease protein
MNPLRTLWQRFRSLWQSRAVKQEIDAELQFHLAMREQENLRAGMSAKDAAREARRRFGNFQSVREECRQLCGVSLGQTVWQDVRFGLRMLRKNPAFTTVAALTLALGIGVNTTMFSTVKALLFADLPFPEPDRVVRLSTLDRSGEPEESENAPDFLAAHDQSTVFAQLGAHNWGGKVNLACPGLPAEGLRALSTTEEFLPALGVHPLVGRVFTAQDTQPGHNDVVLLNRGFWLRHFNGDPQVIGKSLRLDGRDTTIIGVVNLAQPLLFGGRVDLVQPLGFSDWQRKSDGGWLVVVGRLKPGVPLAQAQAEMAALGQRLTHDNPKLYPNLRFRVGLLGQSLLNHQSGVIFWCLFALTGFVLLIACANLANLQLARLTSRARELGIRAALGAGRARLARQLLTESLVLSLLGGALGLALAWAGTQWLGHQFTMEDDGSPLGLAFPLDRTVLGFTFLVSVLSGVIVGTAPAWLMLRGDLNPALKEDRRTLSAGRSRHRLQSALIVGEITLEMPLAICAGFIALYLADKALSGPGWRPAGLMTGEITLAGPAYDSRQKRENLLRQLEERLGALPGVEGVSISSGLPFYHDSGCGVAPRGDAAPGADKNIWVRWHQVDARYFQTLGMTLRQGRAFTAEEVTKDSEVTIISQALAEKLWPGRNPLGKRLPWTASARKHWPGIIGVVNNVSDADSYQIYSPRGGWGTYSLTVRAQGEPQGLGAAVRQAVAELDPNLPVCRFESARKLLAGVTADERTLIWLIGAFGVLGMLLAAVGIYGVTSHVVAQRTGEFGIRIALGAPRRSVLWLVLRNGLRLGLLGALLGAAGGGALVLVLRAAVPDLGTVKEATTIGIWAVVGGSALVVVGAVLSACWLPARRATTIDPMTALRCE